ncbi:MAG: IS3 family transposase [Gaiellaceae bacterium]
MTWQDPSLQGVPRAAPAAPRSRPIAAEPSPEPTGSAAVHAPRETGRYSKAFKEEVLAQVASGRRGTEVCRQYGIPEGMLYRWKRAAEAHGGSVPDPGSTRPTTSGRSPIDEEHRALVLAIKEKLPNAGLAQVQNQLKRFHGVKLSRPMIGRIFTDAGIPLQKRPHAEPSDPAQNRFEMTRPNELWAVDFKEMWIQSAKTYGLFVLDDYSRFCVGHAVAEAATSELAIETMERAIQRYGRPERILSDRGPQFHAWNGVSKFDAFLADFLTDHTVTKAGHCFTNGKVEAFNRSIEAELLDVEEFASLREAEGAITTWIRQYNFHRTHMGIDGLMPADRYFGLVEEARRAMSAQLKTLGGGLRWLRGVVSEDGAARRSPTVLQVVCREDKLELVVLGRRFTLG